MPLAIAIDLSLVSGGQARPFTPASLFGTSDQGFAFDFADQSKLYQDSAGTAPVTAAGQPIGKVLDLSGKGNHATQATAGRLPLWQSTYALFDGTDDGLFVQGVMDFSATDKMTLVVATNYSALNGNALNVGTQGGGQTLQLGSSPFNTNKATAILGLTGNSAWEATATTGADVILASVADIAGATAADEVSLRVNGAAPSLTSAAAGPAGTGNFSATTYGGIGSGFSAGFAAYKPLTGRVYRCIAISRTLSAAEITLAEKWVSAATAVPL